MDWWLQVHFIVWVLLVASWWQDLDLFLDECLGVCSLLKLSGFRKFSMLDVGRAWVHIGNFSFVSM